MVSTAEALGLRGKAERRGASNDRGELELYPSVWASVRAAVESRRVCLAPSTTSYGRETGARC